MFCFECGKEISDAANVCPYCGKPQREGVQLPQEQLVQPQQPQAQPYQQSVQVQQPQAQPYQQPVQVQQPQQASGFIDRLTGGNFMKNFKITTFVAAGLNVLLLILWFAPIFKVDATASINGYGTTSIQGLLGSIPGLPGEEYSYPERLAEAAKYQNAAGTDVVMNLFMVTIAIISVITLVIPFIKKDFAKTRKFIFSKICALIYGVFVIIELVDINNQLSNQFSQVSSYASSYGVSASASVSVGLNFWGVLYMLCAIAVIVVTILMTMQMKKNNSLVTGGIYNENKKFN